MNVRWMMIAGLVCGALGACDDAANPGGVPGDATDRDLSTRPGSPADGTANPPFEQNEQSNDLQTTAAVRRAILDAEDLGMGADNAVITTQAGVVTIRGNVESQAVKDRVEAIARGVPGVVRIENQLEVGDAGQQDAGQNNNGEQTPGGGAQAPNPR